MSVALSLSGREMRSLSMRRLRDFTCGMRLPTSEVLDFVIGYVIGTFVVTVIAAFVL